MNAPQRSIDSYAPQTGHTYAAHPRRDLPSGTLVDAFFAGIAHDKEIAQYRYTPAGWQPISHAELYAGVKRLWSGLRALGVQRGDRIAIVSENRTEWPLADYANICLGALTVPIYQTLTSPQIAYILRHSGARLVFASGEQLAKVLEARTADTAVETVITFDDVPAADGVLRLQDVLQQGAGTEPADAEFRAYAQQARPDDIATLIYTSGTTAEPKGVMLTHNNLFTNLSAALSDELGLNICPQDSSLSFLPLSHVLQRLVDYAFFRAGVSIAYVPNMDLVAKSLQDIHPTIAVSVPRLYEKLYARILSATGVKRALVVWARQVAMEWTDAVFAGGPGPVLNLKHALADRLVYAKIRHAFGNRIRFFVSGGAPLSPVVAKFFYGTRTLIMEGYGLTETSPLTNVNTIKDFRIGTVGKPVPATEIRIADDGEILIRGPQIMRGYYRDDAATRDTIDAEGWLYTGDIGSLDDDNFLRITDRKKEILVTAGGKNIAPQPIQNAAKTSRFVAEALLLADRRPYPIMMVVPNFDSLQTWAKLHEVTGTIDELVKNPRVRARIQRDIDRRLEDFARYERPKKILLMNREFSLEQDEITPTLKVKRRVVEKHFAEEIEALYAEPADESSGASAQEAHA